MSWTAYRLVYQAKSPIHIGWHTLGYIKLTRYYITGKAMWGAMTANITRAGGLSGVADYKGIGDILKDKILMSYFYPATNHEKPLCAKFTTGGLYYGDMTSTKFENFFIKSFGQTAVVPQSNTAEDETLHESEYISPVILKDSKQNPVCFVGYLFISNGYDWEQLKSAISEIFVGGDRKYGWGRLLLDEAKTDEVKDLMIFGNTLILSDKTVSVEIKKGDPIPAHLKINSSAKLKGDIEPLVGREWGEVTDKDGKIRKGFGQQVSNAELCWLPGSIIEEEKPLTFRIGAYGILE